MAQHSRLKTALLAAASLTTAGAATHSVAAEPAPASAIVMTTHQAAEETRAPIAPTAKTVGLAALGAAALGFAAHLLGRERLTRYAKAAVAAPAAALRAVGSAISEPVRHLLALSLFAAIGFVGVGIFNLEWAGGLVIGAGFVALAWVGASRVGAAIRVRRGNR
jgi:hypothetical protein